jgi:SH3 domain protein
MISRIVLAFLLATSMAHAETRYISDELTVPLRRGPSNGHKIINAALPSGTSLEILGEDKAAGFTQVRLQNGTDGWVPTQYLTNEPIARDRLTAATKRIETLSAELSNLRQNVKTEQSARNSAEGMSGDLSKQLKQAQSELAEIRRVSANAVATYEENKSLKEQSEKLQQQVNEQGAQIQSLKSNELQMWLLCGGGLVLIGLIGGVVIKSRPKKRGGW